MNKYSYYFMISCVCFSLVKKDIKLVSLGMILVMLILVNPYELDFVFFIDSLSYPLVALSLYITLIILIYSIDKLHTTKLSLVCNMVIVLFFIFSHVFNFF